MKLESVTQLQTIDHSLCCYTPCNDCIKAADKRKKVVEDKIDLQCTELDVIVTHVIVGLRTHSVSHQTQHPKHLRSCLKEDNDFCERLQHRVQFNV